MSSYMSIYEGSPSYLIPKETALSYLSAGYQSDISSLGMSLDPRTANQLGEVNTKLNPGIKHIEISGVTAGVFESIPEQHLDEIKRLSKLTGVSTSVHGPLVEASGVGERGLDEANRLGAERQLESAVFRSHRLDPNGNIPVITHTTAQLPEMISKIKVKEGEKEIEKTTEVWVINPETRQISQIKPEKKFFPEEGVFTGKPREFDIKEELNKINSDTWTQQLSGINHYASYGENILNSLERHHIDNKMYHDVMSVDVTTLKEDSSEKKSLASIQREITHGQIYLRDAYRNLKMLFDKAYVTLDNDDDKKKLNNFANNAAKTISEVMSKGQSGIAIENVKNLKALGNVVEEGVRILGEIKTPELWRPLQDYVLDKSAETFSNVAASSFKKFGETAPILCIENPPAGGGLSRGEDLKKLVEETRKKFVEKMSSEIGTSEAKKQAEKLIGATWDVGHINMLRKRGYSEEDVVKETEKIAPFVKHVHLSDNFGLDHTELPMGMGNVPLKEILKRLGDKGFEGKKIIEAGNWWQYFADKGGGNPFKPSIEAFDSPIYSMKQAPYWSQLGGYGMYYSGHGPINPPVHHRVYGSGFENLPIELGGEIPGDKGRFSGAPNQ